MIYRDTAIDLNIFRLLISKVSSFTIKKIRKEWKIVLNLIIKNETDLKLYKYELVLRFGFRSQRKIEILKLPKSLRKYHHSIALLKPYQTSLTSIPNAAGWPRCRLRKPEHHKDPSPLNEDRGDPGL